MNPMQMFMLMQRMGMNPATAQAAPSAAPAADTSVAPAADTSVAASGFDPKQLAMASSLLEMSKRKQAAAPQVNMDPFGLFQMIGR
jgi:hypothetical protein